MKKIISYLLLFLIFLPGKAEKNIGTNVAGEPDTCFCFRIVKKIVVNPFEWSSKVVSSGGWKDLDQKPPLLKDTLNKSLLCISYLKKGQMKQRTDGSGIWTIHSEIENEYDIRNDYTFPDRLEYPVNNRFTFGVDWYKAYTREDEKHFPNGEANNCSIYEKKDTVYTLFQAEPTGGITPEGQTFRITGQEVDSIRARTKSVFTVSWELDDNERDGWGERINWVESDWYECNTDKNSYTLPIICRMVLDASTIDKLRQNAIQIQQKMLIQKRDSVLFAIGSKYNKETMEASGKILTKWETQLLPLHNLPKVNLSELGLKVIFEYFLTEIKVYYKGGTHQRLMHLAWGWVSVP